MESLIILRQLINSNMSEIKKLRELSMNIAGADPSKEHISGGPQVQCKFAEIINKLVDLEAEILEETESYIDLERQVRAKINAVEDPTHKLFLRYRYIEQLSYEDIAKKMGYSVRQIYNIRKDCAELHLLSL